MTLIIRFCFFHGVTSLTRNLFIYLFGSLVGQTRIILGVTGVSYDFPLITHHISDSDILF